MSMEVKSSFTQVVGSGLLGNAFQRLAAKDKCLVLAAGVSNSQEQRTEAFLRERSVILSSLRRFQGYRVLYFSTCSAEANDRTAYIEHKLEMEQLIQSRAEHWTVFRLPQVVGVVKNTTIVSYFVRKILDREHILIQSKAERNLIDVLDVVRIVEALLEVPESSNAIVNIAAAENVRVVDIVSCIGKILGRSVDVNLVDEGIAQRIEIGFLREYLERSDVVLRSRYWKDVLRTYVPRIADAQC